jgi:hypothetical protein
VLDALNSFQVWRSLAQSASAIQTARRTGIGDVWRTIKDEIAEALRLPRSAKYHPQPKARKAAVEDPVRLVTDPISNGITIGVVALLLEVLLSGGFAVLDAGQWPVHPGALIIFASISVLMMPLVYQANRDASWRAIRTCAVVALSIGLIWPLANGLLATIMLALAPGATLRLIELYVGTIYRVPVPFVDANALSRLWLGALGLLISTLAGAGLVVIGLAIDVWLKNRFRRGDHRRVRRTWLVITLILACALALALFVVTALAMLEPQRLVSVWTALALSGCIAGVVYLWRASRRQVGIEDV